MRVDILNVLRDTYQTELATDSEPEKGHWLLKENCMYPLYSQTKIITGSEAFKQIMQMQMMIEALTDAQSRLVKLVS